MGFVTRRTFGLRVLVMNHLTILREMSSWGLSAIYDKTRVKKAMNSRDTM
jgi:hypothetical protein